MKDAFIKAFGCYKDNNRQTLAVYHGVIKALERLEKLIEDNANTINFLIEEKNDYKKKCIALEKERQDTKQQLRFLTKRDNKLQEIEQLFEKKSLKIRDISKVLESDE